MNTVFTIPIRFLLAFLWLSNLSNAQEVLPEKPFEGGTILTHSKEIYKRDIHFRGRNFVPAKFHSMEEFPGENKKRFIWYDDKKKKVHLYLTGYSNSEKAYYLLQKSTGMLHDLRMDFYGIKAGSDGKILLPCIYNKIFPVNNHLFILTKNEKQALFDLSKPSSPDFKFDYIMGHPGIGMILLRTGNKYGLADSMGNLKIGMQTGEINLDDFGAILHQDSQTIYIDSVFNRQVIGKFTGARRFRRGVGIERNPVTKTRYRFIDLKGKPLTPYFIDLFPFYEEVSFGRNDSNKWAFIHKQGTAITPFMFDAILLKHQNKYVDIHSGYIYSSPFLETGHPIITRAGEEYDVFDPTGKKLNTRSYNSIVLCGEYAVAGLRDNNGKMTYAVLNSQFRELIPYEFEKITYFDFPGNQRFEMKGKDGKVTSITPEELQTKNRK